MLIDKRAILEEAYRRWTLKHKTLRDTLFDKQKIFDRDKARFKAALNTRRSGKSYLAAVRLLVSASTTPGSQNPYIALTRDSARRILWPTIETLCRDLHLPVNLTESSLTVSFGNSEVFLVGADQKNYMGRLRGIKSKIAIIDEAQSFNDHIESLVDDVLTPALLDYSGDLDIYGTPGLRPNGYFYDVTTKGKGFSVHKWSVLDNPHIPNAQAFIDELMTTRGWTEQNPTYRREWLGEWVLDTDSLLFKFRRERNTYSELPKDLYNRVLGMDFGWHDKTAFVIVSWSPYSKHIFVEHSESHPEMIPSMIAQRCAQLIDKWKPVSIVADTAGLGKSIAEEMRIRYQIPVKAAEKREKATNISLMNGDFIDGNLLVAADQNSLIAQLENVPRGDDGLEMDGVDCDEVDSLLYAYREAKSYASEPKYVEPRPDSEEYILKHLELEEKRKQNEAWWERD